ncbi:MAG: hypothetical protein Q9170_004659 [Blastenia crenularia]
MFRERICGSYDLLVVGRNGSAPTGNLNLPLVNIIQSNEKTLSSYLVRKLTRYNTALSLFRVTLPNSGHVPDDQIPFHKELTKSTEESDRAIRNAQSFQHKIMSNIDYHISDTQYIVQRIRNTGFWSPFGPLENPPARFVAWLNSHRLIYLPIGIEPFKETSAQKSNNEAMLLMETYMHSTVHHMSADVDRLLALQSSLLALRRQSYEISISISRHQRECDHSRRARVLQPLLWVKKLIYGPSYEDYLLHRRTSSLAAMAPVFQNATNLLNQTAHQFDTAYQLKVAHRISKEIYARLSIERIAVKRGLEISDWVKEQARELEVGLDDLEAQLKAFELEEKRLKEQLWAVQAEESKIWATGAD